ncbi:MULTISPECIES: hypothetical protein [Bacillaceae]|uniref:Uncharacterized protein n=1 Tax=Evansella alkalicola TaxID=745819 RepID=A0ABS6K0H4_9BACI|nr:MULTISPECIES: hypothetical protein [Bacillaceae]MBU9723937.1 hypothetical protein [Bacillus alkalicola]
MKYILNLSQDNSDRALWVEEGRIRYSDLPIERSGLMQLNTEKFKVSPGHITLDENIGKKYNEGYGDSYVKQLLLYGFTSFIHLIDIEYESECIDKLNWARDSLRKCPLDYIHAVRVPLERLTDSWIRTLKQYSVPVLFLSVDSIKTLKDTPWQRLFEAMFPMRMLCICEPSPHVTEKQKVAIEGKWEKIIRKYRINSYLGFPEPGERLSLFLTMRIGLFPSKGSLVMGSDADYLMYGTFHENELPLQVPDIIVLKSRVVKIAGKWDLEGIKGEELTSLVPEKFLPIEDIHRYTDEAGTL